MRRFGLLLVTASLAGCGAASGPGVIGPPPTRPGEAVTTWREPLVVNPGYRIYMRNNTDVPLRIINFFIYDCFNVREPCGRPLDPKVVLDPGEGARVFVIHPANESERWNYRYRWATEVVRDGGGER